MFGITSDQQALTISIFDDQLVITHVATTLQPVTIDLEARTVHKGVIFKPAALVAQLAAYLTSAKIKNPQVTINLPPAIRTSTAILPFIVLQYTLALAKANIHIVAITLTSEQPASSEHPTNLLNLLQRQNSRSPKFWILSSLAVIIAFGTGITRVQLDITHHAMTLTNQATQVKATNIDYEKQFRETNNLKTNIKQLQEKDKATQDILHKFHKPTKILSTIAHQTPATIWLTTITLDKATTQKTKSPKGAATKLAAKKQLVTLKGTSDNSATISKLLKNLGRRASGILHPTLVAVAKEKPPKKKHGKKLTKTKLYHFTIQGQVANRT